MDPTRIADADATTLARWIRRREVGAVEAFDAIATRIAQLNPVLNAVRGFDAERGRAEAHCAQQRLDRGDPAALLGVPFTAKDNLWVEGRVSTQGSWRYADFVAPQDALAVQRLRAAGAVFAGFTNCSEFACKGVTTSPLHGATRHPYDLALTPGGSSGGAAAALAAGLVPLALATDGGGSTRRPASHTGVVGMKPSAGLVPHPVGFAEPLFGQAVIGQMARRVADVVALLDAIAGGDAADPQAPAAAVWNAADARPDRLPRNLRIAYSPTLGLDVPVDAEVAAACDAAVQRLAEAGHRVERADPAWPAGSDTMPMTLQFAGLAALYGEALARGEWHADPDIAAQIDAGRRIGGAEVAQALFVRDALVRSIGAFFTQHDLLLSPTTPCVAWPLTQPGPTHIAGRPVGPRAHAVFTAFANHAYVPACSVPIAIDRAGLPIGLQIAGPRWSDARVLALAALVEAQASHDFQRPVRPAASTA